MKKNVVLTSKTSKIEAIGARLAIAAAVAVLLLLASLHVLSPEFDPSWRVVSEYANGRYGWVLSLMFAAWAFSSWALAFTIWPQSRTILGKIGLVFLLIAGVGEAMAAFFDINHDALHNVAGALGILGLPVAAMFISVSLGRTQAWSAAKHLLIFTANLTWMSVVLLAATFIMMIIGYTQAGGNMTSQVKVPVLPPGVIAVVGWANRLLIVVYCVWVMTAAWLAIKAARQKVLASS